MILELPAVTAEDLLLRGKINTLGAVAAAATDQIINHDGNQHHDDATP
jgi:hypothetical protein